MQHVKPESDVPNGEILERGDLESDRVAEPVELSVNTKLRELQRDVRREAVMRKHYCEIVMKIGRERARANTVSDRAALDRTRFLLLLVVPTGRRLGVRDTEQAQLLGVSRQCLHALLKRAAKTAPASVRPEHV